MKNTRNSQIFTLAIALMICFGATQAISAQSRSSRHTLEAGTTIDVRLQSGLSSRNGRVGDTFKAVTMIPVFSSTGVLLIPAGSRMTGRVNSVKRAARGRKPGEIGVEFRSITLPNGSVYNINGSPVPASSGNKSVDSEGTISADKKSNRGLVFVGGGAAGGAVLGGIAGGGTGAAIGAGVGAITGAITGNRTRGPEAEVKSGTEFAVYLNRSVTLPLFAESAQSRSSRHTLEAGTTIDVRLQSGLSSRNGRVGDAFKAVTMVPVFSSTGVLLIPAGSRMTGRVSSVKPAGIGIEFRSITLPNGSVYNINGSPVAAPGAEVKSGTEFGVYLNRSVTLPRFAEKR